ncbi:MAG: hypothetical protein BMS9Abin13_254 [Patescibacteria group bacterium]|nr:MAG: hypothetical protein BMS9Abin13_254 [Patescibacteria group bacterium]
MMRSVFQKFFYCERRKDVNLKKKLLLIITILVITNAVDALLAYSTEATTLSVIFATATVISVLFALLVSYDIIIEFFLKSSG